jgi:hypothetical protein
MGDEKKYDGAGDPFKMLLEEEKHLHQAAMQPPSRYM